MTFDNTYENVSVLLMLLLIIMEICFEILYAQNVIENFVLDKIPQDTKINLSIPPAVLNWHISVFLRQIVNMWHAEDLYPKGKILKASLIEPDYTSNRNLRTICRN